jgi:hypothetical protein
LVQVYAAQSTEPESKYYTSAFNIVPGEPYFLTVETSGKTAISGFGEVTLNISVIDKFSNPVSDGTRINIDSTDLTVDGDFYTTDGAAVITLSGGLTPGLQSVLVSVGEISKVIDINVHDIALEIVMPNEIDIGETGENRVRLEWHLVKL